MMQYISSMCWMRSLGSKAIFMILPKIASFEKTLVEVLQELPPTLHAEVRDFVEFLIAKQRHNQQHAEYSGI